MFGTQQPKEWTLQVGNVNYAHWTSLTYRRAIDSIDTVTFTAPFNPDSKSHRDLFRPATYKEIKLRYGGEVVFTGTMLNPVPRQDGDSTTVQVSAYSLCGVWEDNTLPPSSLPTQFDGLKLEQIAKALGSPFELTPEFSRASGAPFKKVSLDPSSTPLQFISDLARQRGFVVGANADGQPLFWESIAASGKPVARLNGNKQPVLSVTPNQEDRKLYSQITGIVQSKNGRTGTKHTTLNGLIDGFRPLVFSVEDTEPADLPQVVEAKLGRTIAEAISYTVEVGTVLDESDVLFDRNAHVSLKAPEVMIYSDYSFITRAVTFNVSDSAETASLELMLPGAFSGEAPDSLPWQEPGLF